MSSTEDFYKFSDWIASRIWTFFLKNRNFHLENKQLKYMFGSMDNKSHNIDGIVRLAETLRKKNKC